MSGDGRSRNPGLDLARVLAAMMVVVCHFTALYPPLFGLPSPVPLLLGGYFGVELFFVLSGFLIGRILLRIAAGDATLRGWFTFMLRRWLRTLPLYYLWLAVMALALPPGAGLLGHLLSFGTMTQNLAWPMPADEWFNQTWSLTIEEWFYLLFSAALLGAAALARSPRVSWAVIGAFIVVPLAARLLSPDPADFEKQMYHVALLRLDAIAYGVALARLHAGGARLFRHPVVAGLLGVAVIAAFWIQDSAGVWLHVTGIQFLNLQLVATSLGYCLLLVGLQHLRWRRGPVVKLITLGSQISYGLYMMHLAVIERVLQFGAVHRWSAWLEVAVSLPLVFLLPYLSWRFFEAPILAMRPGLRRRPAMVAHMDAAALPIETIATPR